LQSHSTFSTDPSAHAPLQKVNVPVGSLSESTPVLSHEKIVAVAVVRFWLVGSVPAGSLIVHPSKPHSAEIPVTVKGSDVALRVPLVALRRYIPGVAVWCTRNPVNSAFPPTGVTWVVPSNVPFPETVTRAMVIGVE